MSSLIARHAPALFVLIWASGYLFARYVKPHADPLTFLSYRYAGIALFLGSLAWIGRARWPKGRDVLHLAVVGLCTYAGYLGGVWVAISMGMSSGVASLIVNLQPVLTAALAGLVNERLGPRQWLGVLLGFAGVVFVVWERILSSGVPLAAAIALCVFALCAMTTGTLYQKRFVPRFDVRSGQVIQSLAALAATLPFALSLEAGRFDWSSELMFALFGSVVILTGGGNSLMALMLREGKATTVTSYMYLVPAVTALMAWIVFDEELSILALVGMAISLLGIFLVARG